MTKEQQDLEYLAEKIRSTQWALDRARDELNDGNYLRCLEWLLKIQDTVQFETITTDVVCAKNVS